jgi:hypothetical protein
MPNTDGAEPVPEDTEHILNQGPPSRLGSPNPRGFGKYSPDTMYRNKGFMAEYARTQKAFFASITASPEDAERYRKSWPE